VGDGNNYTGDNLLSSVSANSSFNIGAENTTLTVNNNAVQYTTQTKTRKKTET